MLRYQTDAKQFLEKLLSRKYVQLVKGYIEYMQDTIGVMPGKCVFSLTVICEIKLNHTTSTSVSAQLRSHTNETLN